MPIDIDLLLKTKDSWQLALGIITLLSPMILSFIQQPHWETWKRTLLYGAFHVLTTTVYLGAKQILDPTNLVWTFLVVIAGSLASYLSLWKPLADKVEVAKSNAIRKLQNRPLLTARRNTENKTVMDNLYV